MGFALTPGEAPLHFSRSKNVMHVDTSESTSNVLFYKRFWFQTLF